MPPGGEEAQRNALKACLLSFAGLNLLYLLSNAVDLFYLWFTFALPEGILPTHLPPTGAVAITVAPPPRNSPA